MPSTTLKPIMLFRPRRGPNGHTFGEVTRNGRTFRLYRERDGWLLSEVLPLEQPAPSAKPNRAQPPRRAPKRLRRELVALGLVETGEDIRSSS